jgi:predicted molibdopterin-dependent oxidoreductase YjgC
VFGAGGGTSSYREIEETDVILLWGSNARETHPIFFHHLLHGVRNGARLVAIDPRRTSSAQWADRWLGLDVGSDIALSNTMAREIIRAGLHNRAFIDHATEGFDAYAASVDPFTLAEGERLTGVPAQVIREVAHAYARADRAMICWTLGITEHHTAVDNVLALINLGLLCGHVGRYGSGLNPLRGQNNVQGGGDMGAIPNKLPGFQDLERDAEARARFEAAWGTPIPPQYGWHLTQMFHAMERGELRTLYVIGENPAQSEADVNRARQLLAGLDLLVVQDIVMTRTAEMADVVLPGTASWCEAEGTVTNSERRVQRVRKALDPPGEARDDTWIIAELARRLGHNWGNPTAEEIWDECRSLSPMHRGMRYDRLESLRGLQWPCPDEEHPGSLFLHARLWADPVEGPLAPFSVVEAKPPFEALDADYPIRLTTGRRLESFNTGAQSNLYRSPLHRGESLDLSPEDAERLELTEGEVVRISSRRARGRGAGARRPVPACGSRVHDVPLPGRGRRQPVDDRRDRPEVRHRRVQGRGGEGGEAGACAACARNRCG